MLKVVTLPLAISFLLASVIVQAIEPLPIKIAIVQVPAEVQVKKLKAISSEPSLKDKDLERVVIGVRLRQVQDRAEALLIKSLEQRTALVPLNDPASEEFIDSFNLANDDKAIPLDVLKKFKETTAADAILRFRITDYGRIPTKWMTWILIGTGVWITSAVALAATNPDTRPYIGVYIGSEVLEEGAELFLGVSLFEYFYKPVRIEAELIDTDSGKNLWEDAKTRMASGMKAYSKKKRKLREVQFAVATERALDALVDSMMRTMTSNEVILDERHTN